MTDMYVLDGDHNVVPATLEQWMFQRKHLALRRVGLTEVQPGEDGVLVSTVFLGLDHGVSDDGPPILFETLIVGGEYDGWMERCATYTEAEGAHERAVKLAESALSG